MTQTPQTTTNSQPEETTQQATTAQPEQTAQQTTSPQQTSQQPAEPAPKSVFLTDGKLPQPQHAVATSKPASWRH